MPARAVLNDRERRTLAAVCTTLLPSLVPSTGDDAALFKLSANDVALADAVEQAMLALSARQVGELRLFLRLLDNPLFMLIAAGTPSRMTGVAEVRRESVMLKLARNPLPQVRSGYQALKRLATFLFYSVVADDKPNPTWASLGYAPPRPARATASLTLTRITQPTTLEADVCVIGSGAGGGVIAERMATAGRTVIVLEAGSGDQAPDFDQREVVGMQRLYLDKGTTGTRDVSVAILAGSCVGGGTTVNWQTSLRTPDFIRAEWAERSGIDALAGDEFTRALDAVCARSSVGTDESTVNANNAPLERGCETLGFRSTRIARNSHGCDLSQCGFCAYGCRVGGKQSTANTFLRDAQREFRTRIVPLCRADRLRIERGAVLGVDATARDESGATFAVRVNAKTIVVAAGAIESPALLLRSGVQHPELGRNLFLHPTSAVAGRYDDDVRGWIGAPQTVLCDEFGRARGNYGYRFEAAPVHPGLISLAQPWFGARDHRAKMQHVRNVSAIIVLSRDCDTGRVSIDREGRAVIDYKVGQMERDLLREGIGNAARVHHAAGASEIHTLHITDNTWRRTSEADFGEYVRRTQSLPVHGNRCGVFSAHQMGTCRMGADARTNVCDPNGQVNGVRGLYVADASLFPASSGVNPMITVMGLAYFVGSRLANGN